VDTSSGSSRPTRPPAYRVETERLLLRCWSPADAPRFRALLDASDQHLRPWIPWMRDEPRSLAETADRLRAHRGRFDLGQDFRYAVFSPDETTLVGEAGLFPRVGPEALEIGYLIGRDAVGRGYALEAAAALARVAFAAHGIDRLEIHCAPENVASATIPRKLGFTHEATLRRRGTDSDGVRRDSMLWTLFRDAYPRSRAAALPLRAFDCLGERIL
jgi:RimJ/RimL family protein N-acetyltransferase